MRDPRPVFWVFVVHILALLVLVGWWCTLQPSERLVHLRAIMTAEQVSTVPPSTLVAQAEWLYHHRLGRLQGMAGVGAVAALVGVGEGIARRRQDVLGGFLLRWWTAGVVGLALLPGLLGGSLVAPWPLPGLVVASGLAIVVSLTLYGLFAGRPYVP